MPRELYPEQQMMPVPDVIELCLRCKVALVYRPYQSIPKCDKCGDSGRDGELYIKASALVDALVKGALTTPGLPQVVLAIRHLLPSNVPLDALTGPRPMSQQDPYPRLKKRK